MKHQTWYAITYQEWGEEEEITGTMQANIYADKADAEELLKAKGLWKNWKDLRGTKIRYRIKKIRI